MKLTRRERKDDSERGNDTEGEVREIRDERLRELLRVERFCSRKSASRARHVT